MDLAAKPKFVTFDMNGTLIDFRIDDAIRRAMGERIPAAIEATFLRLAGQLRIDECMGEWKPFHQIVEQSQRRATRILGLEYHEDDARAVYDQIPSRGPHPGVPAALRRLAETYPLAIITNTDDTQVQQLVDHLEAPFEVVITSEQQGVYKPRLRAFEGLLERLGVERHEIVHVSSSPQYDLRPAHDLGIPHTVYLDRGFEHDQPWLGYERITDIAQLPVILGA
ncbi:putative hydrolase [Nostocoides japonicum T1-X7]|uniref:Putative hydrolase n=1 Tax=Nostocoides japonicum T1-X7 TaxID=1194083 RepID=A0A077M817_9MICO|nr:haloacid dehalogenase type II [Tetrasphaera japonica]CCH80219.1 putative hydrolase [Tetrasphaera japonica T1-X7]